MEKEFGKIRKGDEETYSMLLLPMESNALKIHRKFPHTLVCLSESDSLETAVIGWELLLHDIGFDGNPDMVGLSC